MARRASAPKRLPLHRRGVLFGAAVPDVVSDHDQRRPFGLAPGVADGRLDQPYSGCPGALLPHWRKR